MKLSLYYQNRQGGWNSVPGDVDLTGEVAWKNSEIALKMECTPSDGCTEYVLEFTAAYPTRIKLEAVLSGSNPWHLVPCCTYGDNNIEQAQPGQYPNLTELHPEERYSSIFWEFRADRAATPVSMLFTDAEAAAISIDPYSTDVDGSTIRNGVYSELPNKFGVTLAYANLPYTFVEKAQPWTPEIQSPLPCTYDAATASKVTGRIYSFPQGGRETAKIVVENEYRFRRECPVFEKTYEEAAKAIVDAFIEVNWSDEYKHYTNMQTALPDPGVLKPWRGLYEIAWTGGAVLSYPFLVAEKTLGLPEDHFAGRKNGVQLFDEIAASYNPASGLFFDLVQEVNGSRVNGWWDGLRITHDRHSAYTNGQALYYLFEAMNYLRENGRDVPPRWDAAARSVGATFLKLQRADGCCGYAYSTQKAAVADWDGFAGCWVAAAFAAAYAYTGEEKFKMAARKGIEFYYQDVRRLNCCGAPMDTWKSPDEEGNFAFIKATRILHEASGDADLLLMLEDGAHYEYLWRYGFRAQPELLPLRGSQWNSCGGSVTSVSNPHLHPMGLMVTQDLYYLAEQTGNDYHRMRAEDGVAFAMNCMELYPDVAGYGRYGVITERFCASDGLTVCHYNNGRPSSMWASFNGWAAANILEALLWMISVNHSCGETDEKKET